MVHLPSAPTLRDVPWAIGREVRAYPRISDQMLADMPPTGVSSVGTAIVDAGQDLTFGDLPYGQYWACAPLTEGMRDFQYLAFGVIEPPPTIIPGPQGEQGPAGPVGPQGPQGAQGAQGPIGLPPDVPTKWVTLASPAGQAANVGANLEMTFKHGSGDAGAYSLQLGNTLLVVRDAGVYAITSWVQGGNNATKAFHTQVIGTVGALDGNPPIQGIKGVADGVNRPSHTAALVRALTAGSSIAISAISDVVPITGAITIAKVGAYVP